MDKHRFINIITLIVSTIVFWSFNLGYVSAANAFFGAGAIIIMYLGRQFVLRDKLPVKKAFKEVFAGPSTYPRNTAYYAFVIALCFNVFLIFQTINA